MGFLLRIKRNYSKFEEQFKILEIPINSSKKQIKDAFKNHLNNLHPDKNQNLKKSNLELYNNNEIKLIKIIKAYKQVINNNNFEIKNFNNIYKTQYENEDLKKYWNKYKQDNNTYKVKNSYYNDKLILKMVISTIIIGYSFSIIIFFNKLNKYEAYCLKTKTDYENFIKERDKYSEEENISKLIKDYQNNLKNN